MSLEAEFAFLSACHSGGGNTAFTHEGLVGLTRALAAGGTLTSAASYWNLPDSEVTVEMVKTFYRHILNKLGKGEALQKAMIEAIDKNREAPYKWGGLFLTGLN